MSVTGDLITLLLRIQQEIPAAGELRWGLARGCA
jgi:hypothetical protein